jgi:DNA-binding IclR family transcriptional regulator
MPNPKLTAVKSPRPSSKAPSPAQQRDGPQYAAPALDKGLDILEILTDAENGMSMAEIAQQLGRSMSEIFRMVITLQRRGWVTADIGDRYHLSSKMFELAHRNRPVRTLVEAALPVMQVVARRAHQSCHVSMVANGRVLVVAHVEAPGNLSLNVRTGSVVNLFTTASGHIMLAFRTVEERTRLVEDHALLFGDPPVGEADWHAAIEAVARNGYALSSSHQIRGVTDIGYPLWDRNGGCAGALVIPYLEDRSVQRGPSVDGVCEILRHGAAEVSRALGYQQPDGSAQ